jgi:hypothetical protein
MKYFDISFSGFLNICMQQRMTLPLMKPAAQFLLPKMKRLLDQRAFGNSTRMLKVAYIFWLPFISNQIKWFITKFFI